MGLRFGIAIGAIVVLIGSTGYLAFAYTSTNSDLTEANATIDDYVVEVAGLEENVASLTDDLDTMTGERDTLLTEKTILEGEKADLEGELDDANGQISSLQSSLSSKTTELNSETARANALQSELNTVMYPRHFGSAQELRDWLQQDDTDSLDSTSAELAFVLQVRALQDGYILVAFAAEIYYGTTMGVCYAFIEGDIYGIYPEDDDVIYIEPIGTYLPSHPIPQGQ